jgi:hypothetical protein
MSNDAPGATPSRAMRATTGASASRVGFATSNSFSRLKNCSGDIANTCAGTGVAASTPALTATVVGGA